MGTIFFAIFFAICNIYLHWTNRLYIIMYVFSCSERKRKLLHVVILTRTNVCKNSCISYILRQVTKRVGKMAKIACIFF